MMGPSPRFKGWAVRGYGLYLLALPLVPAILVSLVKGDAGRVLVDLGSLGLLLAGAWLVRRGLAAEARFEASRVAAAPTLPLKTLGALALAGGVAFCSRFAVGHSWTFAALVAALTMVGARLAYGADPRTDKGIGADMRDYSAGEVAAVLDGARTKVRAIEDAAGTIDDDELAARVRRIAGVARDVIGAIEEDPRGMRRARKFLHTYLDSTQQVTERYAVARPGVRTEVLAENFRRVLGSIEDVFTEQHRRLLEADTTDLDVQIEVLSIRLEREGAG